MSKPDGAIDYTDGGLPVPYYESGSIVFSLFFTATFQPAKWAESYSEATNLLSLQVTHEDADLVIKEFYAAQEKDIGPRTAEWIMISDDPEDTDYPLVLRHDSMPVSNLSLPVSPRYRSHVLFVRSTDEDSGATQEVLAAGINAVFEGEYEERDYEHFGEGTTFRLQNANMPCSAYLMQRVLGDNSNRIIYRSTSAMSVPL